MGMRPSPEDADPAALRTLRNPNLPALHGVLACGHALPGLRPRQNIDAPSRRAA